MNRNQLNRILNKLTAAATPFQGGDLPGVETKITISACKQLYGFNPYITSFYAIRELSPEQAADINSVIKILHENFMRFMYLFCKCKAEEGVNTSQNGSVTEAMLNLKLRQMHVKATKNTLVFYQYGTGQAWALRRIAALRRLALRKLVFEKCRMLVSSLSGPDGKICGVFDYSQPTTQQNVEDIIGMLEPGIVEELIQMSEMSLSPENDPIAGTICAEPKVAIIEDYLVEQGLAIGVAGILAATALGLYLRGNRAAAVALIATATAAVGGTATGAESVMNDVETDYNRSVRFGGQQDCRDSNQTGTVEHGD